MLNLNPSRKGFKMNAKEYLQQAYRLNELINSNQAELDQLRNLSTSISSVDVSKERVQGGTDSHDKIGTIVAKIVDLNDLINDEIDRFVDLKTDIHTKIMQIPDNTEKLVLKYRYIEFCTWEQIAVKLGFTFQWVHVLHKRALKSFDKILNS